MMYFRAGKEVDPLTNTCVTAPKCQDLHGTPSDWVLAMNIPTRTMKLQKCQKVGMKKNL